jgi:hypothetical protein
LMLPRPGGPSRVSFPRSVKMPLKLCAELCLVCKGRGRPVYVRRRDRYRREKFGLERRSVIVRATIEGHPQGSQIDWSQHGRRKALIASLLQIAQRNLNGISSWARVLQIHKNGIRDQHSGPHTWQCPSSRAHQPPWPEMFKRTSEHRGHLTNAKVARRNRSADNVSEKSPSHQ